MTARSPSPVAVALQDVSVWRYRSEDRAGSDILSRVSLTIGAGEHWAILGPNGAGKTTLLDLCAARSQPSSGTAAVLGRSLGRTDLRELRREIGHVAGEARTWRAGLTALQVVLTGARSTIAFRPEDVDPAAADRASELLHQTDCERLTGRDFASLSRGERQRVMIARALMSRPRLLVLDEPSAGLDLAGRETLLGVLDRLTRTDPARTTVTVTHHLEELPRSVSHAVLLRGGRVMHAGPVGAVLTTERVSACFGLEVVVNRVEGRVSATARGAPSDR